MPASRHMFARFVRHLRIDAHDLKRLFDAKALRTIEKAVAAGEARHSAELRVVLEASLSPWQVLRRLTSRKRAVQLFSDLRVWDTEHNNGVLLYVLLADRAVEIVPDRAAASRISAQRWEAICMALTAAYRKREYLPGTLAAIEEIHRLLTQEFANAGESVAVNPNELPDDPIVL